jgi:exodeoxyribonuclease V alpha subunit
MTVHRGQGSEFDEILLALPETDSPILDRALIYTGLTRAKNKAQLLGPAGVLEAGIKRAPASTSALRERLSRQTGS